MSNPLFHESAQQFITTLGGLSKILYTAADYATDQKIDPKILCEARLFPNMFNLTRQVQIATDMVRNGSGRLAGVELLAMADTETSFDELQLRITKSIEYIKNIAPNDLNQAASRAISITVQGRQLDFRGSDYLITWVQPNFYFHISTAYAILRHNGVNLGKRDFLNMG